MRALIILLKRPGKIVPREELRQKLWPEGTYVDFDGSLNVIFKKLRAAIEDDSENPRRVETVPRRGYRFIASVPVSDTEPKRIPEIAAEPQSPPASPTVAIQSEKQPRHLIYVFATSIVSLVRVIAHRARSGHLELQSAVRSNYSMKGA